MIGCEAMLHNLKRKDGKWFVDIFNDKHNHDLSLTSTKLMKHQSHGKFFRLMACKSLMVDLSQSGLKSSQIEKASNEIKLHVKLMLIHNNVLISYLEQ